MTGDALRRRPAAVIFDMDGLMLDTEPLAARAWVDAAQDLGLAFDSAINHRLIGRSFADCRTIIGEHHGADYPVDALMGAWHGAYDAIVRREGISFKPGLLELLDWLEAERIPKAVATSTRRSRAQAKLELTGIFARFAALVGGDEVARGKPAPDIFLEAAARLDTAPAACLVLEDSEPGMRGALAAGMTPIMVPDLLPPTPSLLAAAPLVVATLHDVRLHLSALPA
jgi:HAD superfamily hydrolase (TIGR01509 family)